MSGKSRSLVIWSFVHFLQHTCWHEKTAKLITFCLFQLWQIADITLVTAPTASQCITVFTWKTTFSKSGCHTHSKSVGVKANESNSVLLVRISDKLKEKIGNKRLQLTQFAELWKLSRATTDWRPIKQCREVALAEKVSPRKEKRERNVREHWLWLPLIVRREGSNGVEWPITIIAMASRPSVLSLMLFHPTTNDSSAHWHTFSHTLTP